MNTFNLSLLTNSIQGDFHTQWEQASKIVQEKVQKSLSPTLLTVNQNITRAIYEISSFFSTIKSDDFYEMYTTIAYESKYKNGKRNEIQEIKDLENWGITILEATNNTLPPNKKIIVQKQDPTLIECPQAYPTVEFLEYISQYKQNKGHDSFIFIGTVMSSSIFGTPHAQVQPNYNHTITTLEKNLSENQKFTAKETSAKLREYNKQWKLCTLLVLEDWNFAIMEVDNFLGIYPRPFIKLDETQWYELTFEDNNETLFAQMARDFSWNQWLALWWVELWTNNVVFEKETLYYRFYKWFQKWVSEDQMNIFLWKIFDMYSAEELSILTDDILQKTKKFNDYMTKLSSYSNVDIVNFIDTLRNKDSNNQNSYNTILWYSNRLQQNFLISFLLLKWKIILENNQLLFDDSIDKDITLFSPEQLRFIYEKARFWLISHNK